MRIIITMIAVALAAQAMAYDEDDSKPRQPRSSSNYDATTGNMTNTQRRSDGSSDTYGANTNNGSQWQSHSDRRGNQSGTDADGNMWNYNRGSNTYFNYGTGKMCTGSGYTRVCN